MLRVAVDDGCPRRDARVVDEDVDALSGPGEEALDVCHVAQVGGDGFPISCFCQFPECCLIAPGEDYPGTLIGQCPGTGGADAAGGTGDECALVLKAH